MPLSLLGRSIDAPGGFAAIIGFQTPLWLQRISFSIIPFIGSFFASSSLLFQ
jgi:hypothetical protein